MKYSIILPVRNGGTYLTECINSILAQSLPDFDLLILENGSTDDTMARIHAFNDPRIKVFPATQPLNIEENWGRIAGISKNEFMTMIGHDDVLDKDYLRIMDQLIQQYPDAGLYQAHFRYIDKDGKEIRKCVPMAEKQTPPEVLHNFLCSKMDIMGTGFMMRSADYDRIGGIPAYANLLFADMELWTELARKSYLAVSQQECFSYRIHAAATTSTSVAQKAILAYDRFVQYLLKIKQEDPQLAKVIYSDADYFLNQYCQGITHKVLRTAHSKRETASVSEIIDRFREYGKELKGDNSFEPLSNKKIKLGKTIDNNPVLHGLFLLFKKIYSRPIAG